MEACCQESEEVEQNLVQALATGAIFGSDSSLKQCWPIIRASFVRELLQGLDDTIERTPQGLRLHQVRIEGRFDLDYLQTDIRLELERCDVPDGFTARHARLAELRFRDIEIELKSSSYPILDLANARLEKLDLTGTRLTNPDGLALDAGGLTVRTDAVLAKLTAEGRGRKGTVRFPGAHIGGQFIMNGARLTSTKGPALNIGGMQTGNGAYFEDNFVAKGQGELGTVRALGAKIDGRLLFNGATLRNSQGPALIANDLEVESNAQFKEKFSAKGTSQDPAVQLLGATIGGHLEMQGARLKNAAGPALTIGGAKIKNSAYFNESFSAEGLGDDGAMRIPAVIIRGHLIMNGAELINRGGPALVGDTAAIGNNAHFRHGFHAVGHGDLGAVRLPGVTVGSQLIIGRAYLENRTGPALIADRIEVQSTVLFQQKFTADGWGPRGAVRLSGATISGHLVLDHARFTNTAGPALLMDRALVKSNVDFRRGFTAEGCANRGAVRMAGAAILGRFEIRKSTITNSAGQAIRAISMTVHQDLDMEIDPEQISVDLRNTVVKGQFDFKPTSIPNRYDSPESRDSWSIAGFTYGTLGPLPQQQKWFSFLRSGVCEYSPQSYRHMVLVISQEGNEELARKVAIAQHDDERTHLKDIPGRQSKVRRFGKSLLKWTVGYGYRWWLPFIWLFGIVLVGLISLSVATGLLEAKDSPCAAVDLVRLALDTVPFLDGSDAECDRIESSWAGLIILTTMKVLVWAALTLFVVGLTSIIRRPGI